MQNDDYGQSISLILCFTFLPGIFVVGAAYATLQNDSHTENSTGKWRVFVALCTLPCLLSIIVGFLCVPESARWLSSEGKNDQALKILRDAAMANGHSDPYEVFPRSVRIKQEVSHKNASINQLFKPSWREKMLRM